MSLGRGVVFATWLRSFLVQGSWNYHTMLGCGFGFAMIPGLRAIYREDRHAFDRALARHADHFNAHPYLSGVALGAALALEAEGADDEAVRRFKVAVRGPLGSLGDGLVWAMWLPGTSVLALTLYAFGVPGWLAALTFLMVYNVGHLGLRIWGLKAGLRAGRGVGAVLAEADLAGKAASLRPWVTVVLGVLFGALLTGSRGVLEAGVPWIVAAVVACGAGAYLGHRSWRPAAVAVVALTVLLSAWGVLT